MTETGVTTATDPRRTGSLRRLGYRLLPGDAFSYILHLRPREWPIVAGHTLFGFLLAATEQSRVLLQVQTAILGTLVFVLLLNGGTLAINSAFDQDEGDIGYLDAPPPPPRHLLAFGLLLMVGGQLAAAFLLPRPFSLVYGACLVMSILYSVPPFRWKAVAGLDLAINAAGFGALTPLAGWTLGRTPVTGWAACLFVGFAFLFASLYPLTQLYQVEEDRARGDQTLAIRLGIRGALVFSVVAMIAAFALFAAALVIARAGASALLVLPALTAWSVLLRRWFRDHPSLTPAEHKAGMYRALQAWALTNACLLLVFVL